MEHLRCVVERITYQNADNGYTVLKCAVKNYSDLVTVVGTMPDTHVGSVLSLEGMWKMDAKYGRQFLVEKFEETLPATVYGIEKYLGSDSTIRIVIIFSCSGSFAVYRKLEHGNVIFKISLIICKIRCIPCSGV